MSKGTRITVKACVTDFRPSSLTTPATVRDSWVRWRRQNRRKELRREGCNCWYSGTTTAPKDCDLHGRVEYSRCCRVPVTYRWVGDTYTLRSQPVCAACRIDCLIYFVPPSAESVTGTAESP